MAGRSGVPDAQRAHSSRQAGPNAGYSSLLETQKLASKFMENFDPETSARERRKLNRKLNNSGRKKNNVLYDDRGIHIETGLDLCDCLKDGCEGCFFPCPKCSSSKCGNECRVLRKFMYDSIEYAGSDYVSKNPYSAANKN